MNLIRVFAIFLLIRSEILIRLKALLTKFTNVHFVGSMKLFGQKRFVRKLRRNALPSSLRNQLSDQLPEFVWLFHLTLLNQICFKIVDRRVVDHDFIEERIFIDDLPVEFKVGNHAASLPSVVIVHFVLHFVHFDSS